MADLFFSHFYLTALLVCAVVFVNGWTDAPNAVATCVASKALSARRAINLAALFNFLGLFSMMLFNNSVARGIVASLPSGKGALSVLCSAMIAIVLFAVVAWYFGIPTSESHALVAALSGASVAAEGKSGFSVSLWGSVILGIVVTSGLGFLLGFAGKKVFLKKTKTEKNNLKKLQIVSSMLLSYIHGAQDGQKFSAVMLYALSLSVPAAQKHQTKATLFCAFVLALGTAVGGMRIIKKVGTEITDVDALGGVCCDAAAFISILICTLLGMPVSTTHTKTTAVLGVGAADKNVHIKPFLEIMSVWLLTFPLCFILGYLIMLLAK